MYAYMFDYLFSGCMPSFRIMDQMVALYNLLGTVKLLFTMDEPTVHVKVFYFIAISYFW